MGTKSMIMLKYLKRGVKFLYRGDYYRVVSKGKGERLSDGYIEFIGGHKVVYIIRV